ncbi:MAG TPA: Rieske 2Fe-2S domain-containing protein [Thermoanaerobaculia bacterium]|nr:Rieske 2Fe-2S domain-containing protein [Thermoanaerobaculia bacterium]
MSTRHDELPKGEGKLLADKHVALYRDAGGSLHASSSVCPHRGCDVDWNGQEKVWDCPCHGSRFTPEGAVIRGPAAQPLAPAEVPE